MAFASALYQLGGELAVGCCVVGFGVWLFRRYVVPDLRKPLRKKRRKELAYVPNRQLVLARDREIADTRVTANTGGNPELLARLITMFKDK